LPSRGINKSSSIQLVQSGDDTNNFHFPHRLASHNLRQFIMLRRNGKKFKCKFCKTWQTKWQWKTLKKQFA